MAYLALLTALPARESTTRMRAWRALKALGCATLRDGVYLLPDESRHAAALEALAHDIREAGGSAELCLLAARDAPQDETLRAAFDRGSEYADLIGEAHELHAALDSRAAPELTRRVAVLRRRFEQVVAVDFFPGPERDRALEALDGVSEAVCRRLSPDEPGPVDADIARLDPRAYRGRTWATRRRPWVDRLASAWLIRRFIDPQARFLWLAAPAQCPEGAIGFDFDGATFSHAGERVTFETLIASFGLDGDHALARIARIVHCLDVGGLPVAEAAGVESLLAGMRAQIADDDELVEAAARAFDFLYHAADTPPKEST